MVKRIKRNGGVVYVILDSSARIVGVVAYESLVQWVNEYMEGRVIEYIGTRKAKTSRQAFNRLKAMEMTASMQTIER